MGFLLRLNVGQEVGKPDFALRAPRSLLGLVGKFSSDGPLLGLGNREILLVNVRKMARFVDDHCSP